jgi:hypothetical protein
MPTDLDSFDFSKLGQEAVKLAETTSSGQAAANIAPPVANVGAPATQPPNVQTQQPTVPATAGQPVAGDPTDPLIDVDFGNGRVEKLTRSQITAKLAEADANGLRQADYTRKTQELARQRQEVMNAQQELEQYRLIRSNPQALYQQLHQQFGQPFQARCNNHSKCNRSSTRHSP